MFLTDKGERNPPAGAGMVLLVAVVAGGWRGEVVPEALGEMAGTLERGDSLPGGCGWLVGAGLREGCLEFGLGVSRLCKADIVQVVAGTFLAASGVLEDSTGVSLLTPSSVICSFSSFSCISCKNIINTGGSCEA